MSTQITDTQLFLLFGSNRPAVTCSNSEQRWFDEGNIISFTSISRMYPKNAEFEINDSDNWKIWFSQLNLPLCNENFDGSLGSLQITSFLLKNGDYLSPCKISPFQFWESVEGRQFKVANVTPCYVPNKKDPRVQSFLVNKSIKHISIEHIYSHIYSMVFNDVRNRRGENVRNMLKPQKCYDFIEI